MTWRIQVAPAIPSISSKGIPNFTPGLYAEKKSVLNEIHQNGFVDLKKLSNELKYRKKLKFKYTEP